ncbi:MFS transporter [Angustibacter sp. McL0619]|uniref:MFS transporter n=1 Tax=Angustibacter sp. McL0619 TaxID=3415676 RepID=UPI003CF372F6
MSTTFVRATPTEAVTSSSTERLPWPSLLVLGVATFTMVSAEMLPTAVLVPMSQGLGVADSQAAQLVSLWAAVVVVASFPLVALTRRFDRRGVVVTAMLVLAASAGLTALAPSYDTAVAARLLGAGAVGLLWATVNAHLADLVPERLLGAAISVVLGGATLGMVLGTPVARLVADLAGWRTSFAVLGGFAVVVAVLVRAVVAPGRRTTRTAAARTDNAHHRSIAPLLALTGLVALMLVGHYGAFTFITLLAPVDALPGGTSTLLLGFGVASVVGIAVAGRVHEQTRTALVISVAATAATLVTVRAADGHAIVGLLAVLAWGVASGALPALAQTEIMRRAGTEHRATAGALIPVLFNGGIAVGAALASVLAAASGVGAIPLPAAAVVLAAAAGLVVVRR